MTHRMVWPIVVGLVAASTAGDVLTAKAMRMRDLDEIRAQSGLAGAIKYVTTNGYFLAGIACLAASFYALLAAFSREDVSLVAPAAASLTFVTNAFAARVFLKEDVGRRRWISALLVCGGVALLTR